MADQEASIFDLSTVERADAGVEVELYHPSTQLPMGVFVTVLGEDSSTYRAATRAAQDRRLAAAGRGQAKLTAEQLEEERLALLAACVTGWRETGRFKMPPYSPDAVRELFTRCPWAREQVDAAVGNRGLFLKG